MMRACPVSPELFEFLASEVAARKTGQLEKFEPSILARLKIREEFLKIGLPEFEYALLFRFPSSYKQVIHIDGVNEYRSAALNLTLHGDGEVVQWFESPPPALSNNPIKSFNCTEENSKLVCEERPPKSYLMRTDVPHRVITDSSLTILSLRFRGNPSFTDVLSKLQ